MGKFLPLPIKLVGGQTQLISTITEAEVALQGQWRNKETAAYKNACRLIEAAKDGTCSPTVAFAAFKAAAVDQRLVQISKSSAALRMLDNLLEATQT
jgi:Protein of unknown function (DUF982)